MAAVLERGESQKRGCQHHGQAPFILFGRGCGCGDSGGENKEGQGESGCGDGERGDGECRGGQRHLGGHQVTARAWPLLALGVGCRLPDQMMPTHTPTLMYSGSKNCPNVWLFCSDWFISQQPWDIIFHKKPMSYSIGPVLESALVLETVKVKSCNFYFKILKKITAVI